MSRPRTLPDFYPVIPPIISAHTSLAKLADLAVTQARFSHPSAGLTFLQLYNRCLKELVQTAVLEMLEGNPERRGRKKPVDRQHKHVVVISEEVRRACLWARHKGKYNWEEDAK